MPSRTVSEAPGGFRSPGSRGRPGPDAARAAEANYANGESDGLLAVHNAGVPARKLDTDTAHPVGAPRAVHGIVDGRAGAGCL